MFTTTPPETSSSVSSLGSTPNLKLILFFWLGCHNYSVPAHVREQVDLIKPTVQFNHRPSSLAINKRAGGLGVPTGRNGPKKSSKTVTGIAPSLDNCDQMITLNCLRALYSINHIPHATHKNSYGIGTRNAAYPCSGLLIFSSRIYTPIIFGRRSRSLLCVRL